MTIGIQYDTPAAQPMLAGTRQPFGERVLIKMFVFVPMLALAAAVPLAWGWGLSWIDLGLAVFCYFLGGLGITVGFHRHFTHRAFKATRGLRIGLAVAGSMAFQGSILTWVADHRRHHSFTDTEGDPHSPWAFGTTPVAVARGFLHATSVGCSTAPPPIGPASPPTCSPTPTSRGSTGSSSAGRCSAWPLRR